MPAEKAEKDQKFLYGSSHFGYENTDSVMCCASQSEIMKTSTKAYTLEGRGRISSLECPENFFG